MLLVKLGVLAFMGKQFYLPFVYAHLLLHTTQGIKKKLKHKLESDSKCSQQRV
jgi:hypothetical protein